MKLSEFNYKLPQELIAQYPLSRGTERLMVVDRKAREVSHSSFSEIENHLKAGDCLVMNDSRVIPARLFGKKSTGGKTEVFLLNELKEDTWECLVKSSKPPAEGMRIYFETGLKATIIEKTEETSLVVFNRPDLIFASGSMPLPPYISRKPEDGDSSWYQTVYAKKDGSVAAPTAGLHFTREKLTGLLRAEVEQVYITLHVGLGTFQPVRASDIEQHKMHKEDFYIGVREAKLINQAIDKNRRIVSTGTTTARVLEHLMKENGEIVPGKGSTSIFIRPGVDFKCIGALLTNFHLPCSTLIMLVCAFGGYELMMYAYEEAVRKEYRFFSYGDAMLIV